jgi:catalase
VHARGTAAHGYFELTDSRIHHARMLTEVACDAGVHPLHRGRRRGSVDTRATCAASRSSSPEGNWDLVGNNIPVFFIQDAMKFPDLVHAVKMEPDRAFPQAASPRHVLGLHLADARIHAHDHVGDERPRHPAQLRMIEGFGVHSFRLLNEAASTFVKFHWRPKLGIQSTVWDGR